MGFENKFRQKIKAYSTLTKSAFILKAGYVIN